MTHNDYHPKTIDVWIDNPQLKWWSLYEEVHQCLVHLMIVEHCLKTMTMIVLICYCPNTFRWWSLSIIWRLLLWEYGCHVKTIVTILFWQCPQIIVQLQWILSWYDICLQKMIFSLDNNFLRNIFIQRRSFAEMVFVIVQWWSSWHHDSIGTKTHCLGMRIVDHHQRWSSHQEDCYPPRQSSCSNDKTFDSICCSHLINK